LKKERTFIIIFVNLFVFIILSSVLSFTAGASSNGVPLVNGLFYGDDDYLIYDLYATAENERGFLYTKRISDVLYVLARVSDNVNDNAFDPKTSPGDYTASVGWTPPHDFKSLLNSDRIDMKLDCGTKTWTWTQDLLYDASGTGDWRSDQYGPTDGATVVGTGGTTLTDTLIISSSSSLVWNMTNVITWDVTQGSTNIDDWKSLDVSVATPDDFITTTTITDFVNLDGTVHEKYPFFNDVYMWEWSLNYEMAIDLSDCVDSTPRLVSSPAAHNSPAKDDNPDIEIPTAIKLLSISVDTTDSSSPYLLIFMGIMITSAGLSFLLIRRQRQN
jgi:hypothetical protein